MADNLLLAERPEDIVHSLLSHLNSLDVETMLRFYHPDAVIIDAAGCVHRGPEAIGVELETYFSLGLQMSISQRHLFVTTDTALLILDWSYIGTARNGAQVNMVATATDIARRGDDGFWRYLIDNPFGAQIREPI